MTRTRMAPEDRKEQLTAVAAQLAHAGHYQNVSLRAVAAMAGVSHPLVLHYFESAYLLQSEVLKYARRLGLNRVLAQAVVANDLRVRYLSKTDKRAIVDSVT